MADKRRRWRILLVDDLAQISQVLGGAKALIGAELRDALAPDGEHRSSPFPLLYYLSAGAVTLPKAWSYLSQCDRSLFPDAVILDIRLDGSDKEMVRREPCDFRGRSEWPLFEALREEFLAAVRQNFNLVYSSYSASGPGPVAETGDDVFDERSAEIANDVQEDLRSLKSSFLELEEQVKAEIDSTAKEVDDGLKIGLLSRGGLFLGERVRALARDLGLTEEPLLIYYSGSFKARGAMLPQVVTGREDLLVKGDYSLIRYVTAKLEERARKLMVRNLVTAARIDRVREAVHLLHGNYKKKAELIKAVTEQPIFEDWTIAALFPARTLGALGGQIASEFPSFRVDELLLQEFAGFLQGFIPIGAERARLCFTQYPWKNALHAADRVGRTESDQIDFERWGWSRDGIPAMLQNADQQAFSRWSGQRAQILAVELVGLLDGSQPDLQEQVEACLHARMLAAFARFTPRRPYWPFWSAQVRAELGSVLGTLFSQPDSGEAASFWPTDQCNRFVRNKDGTIEDQGGNPVYWFYVTPPFQKYVSNPAAPEPDPNTAEGSPTALLRRLLFLLGGILGTVGVQWTSKAELPFRAGHERSLIWLFGSCPKGFSPPQLNAASGAGGTATALWSLGVLGESIGLRALHQSSDSRHAATIWDGSWTDARFEKQPQTEKTPIRFPSNCDFAWELSLPVYRKGA